MPKIAGGNNQTTGKCWNDIYISDPVTVGGLAAVLKAKTRDSEGWNGASILARIDYMKRVMNVGLCSAPDSLLRAQKTIANLEGQL